jgi:hypothetical protein
MFLLANSASASQRICMDGDHIDFDITQRSVSFWINSDLLHLFQCVESINDFPKNCVFEIQGGLWSVCDEELGSIGATRENKG